MSGDLKAYVIHLERAQDRRAQVEQILQAAPVKAEILPACDGAKLSEAERGVFYPGHSLMQPRYPFQLSVGELGCFQSHRTAWQRLLDEGLDRALILEDDVELLPEFEAAFTFGANQPERFGYIQFQTRPVSGEVVASGGGKDRLLRPAIVPLRTSAQLVTRDAATRLLAASEQIDRPVDTFIQMVWKTDVPVYCVDPSGIKDRTAEAGGSTISRKRSFSAKIAAEWKRARYRRAVSCGVVSSRKRLQSCCDLVF